MIMSSFAFRFSRAFAPCLMEMATLIAAEYERAMLAASYYDALRVRDLGELRRQRIGPGGVPRAVFEAFYSE
jgi:hypothetical protein